MHKMLRSNLYVNLCQLIRLPKSNSKSLLSLTQMSELLDALLFDWSKLLQFLDFISDDEIALSSESKNNLIQQVVKVATEHPSIEIMMLEVSAAYFGPHMQLGLTTEVLNSFGLNIKIF